jgi:AcrR family transcriptional regulator
LFTQYGVKTVRLDDIAQQLGISKTTVYHHVSDKEELVRLVLEDQLNDALQQASAIQTQAPDAINGALHLWDRLILYRRTVSPNLLRDIERHYPAVWDFFQAFRKQYINTILVANLRQGIDQELYREDLNETVIAWLWAELSQWDIPISEADTPIKHHFIRGLLTQKGLTFYDSLSL